MVLLRTGQLAAVAKYTKVLIKQIGTRLALSKRAFDLDTYRKLHVPE